MKISVIHIVLFYIMIYYIMQSVAINVNSKQQALYDKLCSVTLENNRCYDSLHE